MVPWMTKLIDLGTISVLWLTFLYKGKDLGNLFIKMFESLLSE
jgi:hypothetical protein